MTRKVTIKAALKERTVQQALGGLVGCPEGGWAETSQARTRLIGELPPRSARAGGWTVDDLVGAALTVNYAGRYDWK